MKVVNNREGLKAVKMLAAEGIKTNVTVTFSPVQVLFAAKCGASYISPFVGRLDAHGHIGMDLVRQIKTISDNAVRLGARVLCGGQRRPGKGVFLEPTVLADAPAAAECLTEETFAPVCAFETEDEVIERANASRYGLSAYAFTTDIARAFRLMVRIEAGSTGLNDGVPTTSQCPFGGLKQSGWGCELSTEGLEAFLETKHVAIGI